MMNSDLKRREYVCNVVKELKLKIKTFQMNSNNEYDKAIEENEVSVDVDKELRKRIIKKGGAKDLKRDELHIKKWRNKQYKEIGVNSINRVNKRYSIVKYNDNKYIKPFYRNKVFVSGVL